MIRSLTLALALGAALASASIGDWQAWTYVLSPVMATSARNGIWTASAGGVVYYDTVNQTAKAYTNLDSLPGTDVAGITATSDGTIWVTTSTGGLGRLTTANGAAWGAVGSYRQSGWTFNSRAIATWNDSILLVGGPQGLSLFSTTQMLALDNVTSFGDLREQGVHAITVEKDTIWVGLDGGAAWAVPDWKRIGKAGNLLADPSKWHVIGRSGAAIGNLFRWAPTSGMSYDSTFKSAMDLANGPLIATGWNLSWENVNYAQFPSATYAFPVGNSVGLCVPGKGVALLRKDGSSRVLTPPTGLPVKPIHHVLLESDETIYGWIEDGLWKTNSAMSSLTDLRDFDGQAYYQLVQKNATLQHDPTGGLLAAPWGEGLYRWTSSSGWDHWDATTSCLLTADHNAENYPVVFAVSTPSSAGNWFTFMARNNDSVRVGWLAASAAKPTCYDPLYVSSAIPAAQGGVALNAIASEGDSALWIAHVSGFQRFSVSGTSLKAGSLITVTGVNWLLWKDGRIYYAASGEAGYARRTTSGWKKVSSKDMGIATQAYRQVAVDTLGNLWAAGDDGIQVISVSDTAFVLQKHIDTSVGLLSNDVYGFSLNAESGVVAVATSLGLDIYQSPYKSRPDVLQASAVRPFPNPFRKLAHSVGKVAFSGVTSNSELFIFAADGGLVEHQDGKSVVGDQFVWTPSSRIRPGVYFWAVQDGSNTVRGRLVISD